VILVHFFRNYPATPRGGITHRRLPVIKNKTPSHISVANAPRITKIEYRTVPLSVNHNLTEKITFQVIANLSHDVILGTPWLRVNNAEMPIVTIRWKNCLTVPVTVGFGHGIDVQISLFNGRIASLFSSPIPVFN
jgi:hypothetical protein